MDYERIAEFRNKHIPYREILEKMMLKSNDSIIDMGAGEGFYTKLFAEIISDGEVFCVEREPSAFPRLKASIGDYGNVKIINKDICDLQLKGFNKVFFSTVFHDIDCVEDVMKFMKSNSRKPLHVYLIEFNMESKMGPPLDVRIEHDELVKIFNSYGFTLAEHMDFKYNYFDEFVYNEVIK
ncbi:MAG: rRNA adenine N-6-methyltransferase family protein [Ferroplasma sp.]